MKIVKAPDLKATSKAINKAINKGLTLSAYGAISSLKKRVKQGKDHKGGSFDTLDKKYEKRKSKLGKKAMFEFSGDMLRSIAFETSKKQDSNILRIKFDNDAMRKRAMYNYDMGRDFFNLSSKEETKILDNVEKEINKII